MSNPRLIVAPYIQIGFRGGDEFVIAWFCEGEIGALVGQGDPAQDEWDDAIARRVVSGFASENPDLCRRESIGEFVFASEYRARKVLAQVNAELKVERAKMKAEKDGRPLEDWEVKALQAGWRPPKAQEERVRKSTSGSL